MSETYTLARDGQRPVRFSGEVLAEEHGKWYNGKDQNRYFNLTLYQLENRRYLVQWEWITHWQGESTHSQVETYASMEDALTALEAFDPCAWIEGYKSILANHPEYRQRDSETGGYGQRQERLETHIRERYRSQVSALAQALDMAEDL